MAETLGELIVQLGLDKSSFDSGITALNRQIRVSESELAAFGKAALASGDNLDVLKTRSNTLSDAIKLQGDKMKIYQDSADKSKARIEDLANAQGTLSDKIKNTQSAYDSAVASKGKDADETKALKEELDKLNDEYSKNEEKLKNAGKQYENKTAQVNKTKGAIADLEAQLGTANTKIAQMESATYQAGVKMKEWGDHAQEAGKKWKDVGKGIEDVGKVFSVVSAPLIAIGATAIKSSIDFESAFTGVIKTVDMTTEEMEQMRQSVIDMSNELPHSKEAISGVAEAAGQLGIEKSNIMDFTEAMLNMSVATDLTANEAAESMARFANIMKTPQDEFENLGSTIVDLGNKFASTEPEILNMGLRIAGAGQTAGMTEGDVLGLANALTSVGINAEMGGSAISRIILTMERVSELGPRNKEVLDSTGMSLRELELLAGNNGLAFKELADSMGYTASELQGMVKGQRQLEDFAEVSSVTAEQFRQNWEEDAAGALSAFIQGVAKLDEEGTSAAVTLEEMGIKEMRLRDTLLRSTNASDLFTDSIKTGNEAYKENVALAKEAELFNGSAANQFEVLKNRINSVAVEIGDDLTPKLLELGNKAVDAVTKKWGEMDQKQKENIVTYGAIAAAVGPATIALGKLVSAGGTLITNGGKVVSYLGDTQKALSGVSDTTTTLSKTIGWLASPAGLAALGLAGIVAGLYAIVQESQKISDVTQNLISDTDNLKGSIDRSSQAFQNRIEDIDIETVAAEKLTDRIYDLVEAEDKTVEQKALLRDLVNQLNDIIPDLNLYYDEETNAINRTKEATLELIEAQMLSLEMEVRRERAKETLRELIAVEEQRAENATKLNEIEGEIADKRALLKERSLEYADSEKELGEQTGRLVIELNQLGEEQRALSESDAELKKQQDELTASMDAYEQKLREYATANDNAKQSIDDFAAKIGEAAGTAPEDSRKIAEAILSGFETLPDELLALGQGAALALVNSLVEGGDLAEPQAQILRNRVVGALEDLETETGTVSKKAVDAIARELANGHGFTGAEAVALVRAASDPFNELPGLLDGKSKESVDAVMKTFRDNNLLAKETTTELGEFFGEGLKDGIFNKEEEVKQASTDVAQAGLDGVEETWDTGSPSKKATELGEFFGDGLKDGIENRQSEVEQIAKETAQKALEQIESYVQPFYDAGYNLGVGAADGLRAAASQLIEEARQMARSAMEAIRAELDIHSPSRVSREIFRNVGRGAVLGLEDEQETINRAARTIAQLTARGLESNTTSANASNSTPVAVVQPKAGTIIEKLEVTIYSNDITQQSEASRVGRAIADSAARKMRLMGVMQNG